MLDKTCQWLLPICSWILTETQHEEMVQLFLQANEKMDPLGHSTPCAAKKAWFCSLTLVYANCHAGFCHLSNKPCIKTQNSTVKPYVSRRKRKKEFKIKYFSTWWIAKLIVACGEYILFHFRKRKDLKKYCYTQVPISALFSIYCMSFRSALVNLLTSDVWSLFFLIPLPNS